MTNPLLSAPWQIGLAHALEHDFGAQLRHISGFNALSRQELEPSLTQKQADCLSHVTGAADTAFAMLKGLGRVIDAESPEFASLSIRTLGESLGSATPCYVGEIDAPLLADARLLKLALEALFDNARTYGRGVESVLFRRDPSSVTFAIQDVAHRFSQDDFNRAVRLFERLTYRPSKDNPGVGIPFASTVAWSHSGALTWQSPGCIQISLPVLLDREE